MGRERIVGARGRSRGSLFFHLLCSRMVTAWDRLVATGSVVRAVAILELNTDALDAPSAVCACSEGAARDKDVLDASPACEFVMNLASCDARDRENPVTGLALFVVVVPPVAERGSFLAV